jgi:hypothetical protein
MKFIHSLLILAFLALTTSGFSEPRIIKGTVFDKNGKEAKGVIVTADKSRNKYYTSFDGYYEIKVKTNSKWLNFKFSNEEIKLNLKGIERDVIDFRFPAQTKNLSQDKSRIIKIEK